MMLRQEPSEGDTDFCVPLQKISPFHLLFWCSQYKMKLALDVHVSFLSCRNFKKR